MRDILYQNLTSIDKRRRDLFIQELVEKDGFLTCTQKRATYLIKAQTPFKDITSMQEWVNSQNEKKPATPRHIYIIRRHNTKLGEDRLICKVVGTLYIVANCVLYHVIYTHVVKIDFMKTNKDEA